MFLFQLKRRSQNFGRAFSGYLWDGKKAGKPYIYSIEREDGELPPIEIMYTPYTIRVKECLKGKVSWGKTVYNCPGGETDDLIYQVENVGEVEAGDEVLLFLCEENYGYGPAGVYIVEDGETRISNQVLS